MSEKTTREDIKTVVESIHNVGMVYDWERYANLYADDTNTNFLDLFKTRIDGQDVIRGWTIGNNGWTSTQKTLGNPGLIERRYLYKIRGFFGLDDKNASEKTAMIIIEDVVESLEDSIDTDNDTEVILPADLTTFEIRELAGALVHYAEIDFTVIEYRC